MINFCLEGHDFGHEVQTMIQVFFPNLHYYKKDNIESCGITVVSKLTADFSYAFFYVDGKLKGEKKCEYNYLDVKTLREKKRIIKLPIYLCLKEITGYEPKWGMITGIRPAKTVNELLDEGYDEKYALDFLTNKYFTSDEKAELTLKVAKAEREILSKNKDGDFSLYIGIPFCPTRCLYCSFTSYTLDKYKNKVDGYIHKLIEEIHFISESVDKSKLKTIYIGGGTPTSLNEEQLENLLIAVRNSFDLKSVMEYTVEAGRPDTITKRKLEILKEFGVDRISINPQTMNQKTLDVIGRRHSVEDVRNIYKIACDVGFTNINMDLILGLPGETLEDVKNTMEEILTLNPASITVHTLAIKRASRLKETLEEYDFAMADSMEHMISISSEYAKKMGMEPYYMYRQKNMLGNFENVGYCKEGYECIYNIQIMEEKQTIIAVGAGATSKIYDSSLNQITRVFNVKSVEDYLSRFDEMLERKKLGIFLNKEI